MDLRLPNTSGTTLLYRSSCPKCRMLAWLAVLLSLRQIRRVPINSAEAGLLYQQFPNTSGQLALFWNDRLTTGWRVVPAGLAVMALAWWRWLRDGVQWRRA